MFVPLAVLILFLRMNGSMPDLAHVNVAHVEYLLRGWWPNWQMHMRLWRPQEYALWGGVLIASMATVYTLTRGK
jgi:hypothetical protein